MYIEPVKSFCPEAASFDHLDPITSREVTFLLVEQVRQNRCILLLVSRDPHLLGKVCDRVVRLKIE